LIAIIVIAIISDRAVVWQEEEEEEEEEGYDAPPIGLNQSWGSELDQTWLGPEPEVRILSSLILICCSLSLYHCLICSLSLSFLLSLSPSLFFSLLIF
jgi:hypothetical protein